MSIFTLPPGFSFPDEKSKQSLSPDSSSDITSTFGSLKVENGPLINEVSIPQIAALLGNIDFLKQQLASSNNAVKDFIKNHKAAGERSIVEFAARNNQVKVLELLVSEFGKAFVDSPNSAGFTPVCLAVQHGALETIKYLNESCGVKLNTVFSSRQRTLLHMAVRKDRVEVAKYLLKTGSVDKDAKMQVVSAVSVSASSGEKKTDDGAAAASSGASASNNNTIDDAEIAGCANAFALACAEASTDMISLLLKEHAHVQNLLEASGSSKQVIEKISEQQDDKKHKTNNDDDDNNNSNGSPKLKQETIVFKKFPGFPVMPVSEAEKLKQHTKTEATATYVIHLERKREIVNSPLHTACANGNFEAVKFLMEKTQFDSDKDTRVSGATPLFLATRFGHTEIVRYLATKQRVEIDKTSGEGAGKSDTERNSDYCTPLFAACFYNQPEIAKILLEQNASSALTYRGASPLIAAIASGSMECLKVLVDLKADVTSTYKGDSPLTFAKSEGKDEVIRFLSENNIQ